MRLLLVVSVTAAFATSMASSPSGHDAQSQGLSDNGLPTTVTNNYHRWDDDRRWNHRWEHYYGDDEEDENDQDGDYEQDQDDWPHGRRHGERSPWTRSGQGDRGDSDGQGKLSYGQDGDEHDHRVRYRGDDKYNRGHGDGDRDREHKSSERDHSIPDGDNEDNDRHGHGWGSKYPGHHDGDADHGKDGGRTEPHQSDNHDHNTNRKHGKEPKRGQGDEYSPNGDGREQDDDDNVSDHGRDGGGKRAGPDWNGGRDRNVNHGKPTKRQGDAYPEKDGGFKPHGDEEDDGEPTSGPFKAVRVAQQLREDTEGFVSDTLEWVNEIIGQDTAATLVIDTTFSLTKNEFADLERGPCGGSALKKVFPALHKFIDHPKDVNLLGDNIVQGIAWAPSSACTSAGEVEGGYYASLQVKCAEKLVLNVSIAASGSTPTIEGQVVEDQSLYINVDIWDGRIQATDAQGSIIGILENRHYPENADDIQKNWTIALQDCGSQKQLSVVGVVGGGWSTYKASNNASDGYEVAVVGYTESFTFGFAETDGLPGAWIPNISVPAPASVGDTAVASPQSEPDAGTIAASGASAYVQVGVLCQQSSGVSPKACAGHAVMSQLTSFYQSRAASTLSTPIDERAAVPDASMAIPLVAVGLLLGVAIVAVVAETSRRRRGYSALEITHQV